MEKVFTKNMFVMLFSIMIGAIIITYFVADIVHRSNIETLTTQHTVEIETLEEMNINFTNHFLKSSVLLDSAREDRAFGNYHFDLAFLWYNSALSETNSSLLELYKIRAIDNCTLAMEKYLISYPNFISSQSFFEDTKTYTDYEKYLEILDIYVDLTGSGARLTMLRYNASKYLTFLTENLTIANGTVIYMTNVTEILDLFNTTMIMHGQELEIYEELQEAIDEYEFFDEIR
jgi:hypothetical protein